MEMLCFVLLRDSITNLLLLYYSMVCRDLKAVWEADEMWAGYNFILFYTSAIPYLIVMRMNLEHVASDGETFIASSIIGLRQ